MMFICLNASAYINGKQCIIRYNRVTMEKYENNLKMIYQVLVKIFVISCIKRCTNNTDVDSLI